MSYNPSNPNGQATSANSAPVVLASDQSAIPITDNAGSITVDGSVTVSGTVTANAGTGTMNVSVQNVSIPVTDNGGSLTVDGSVSVSNFPATQAVSATNLDIRDLTATDVVTVTGGAGQTADVKVTLDSEQVAISNFPATQTVSGTVTVQDGGGSITVDGTVAATQSGTWNIGTLTSITNTVTVSGTVTANAGTGTFATSDANAVSQSTATAAQKGYLSLAGVTATLPTYTPGNTNAMTMTTNGLLRVDGSNVTQPVSGTITANAGTGNFTVVQATASNLNATVTGSVTADTELPAATTLAEGMANPTTPLIGAANLLFNGTAWKRLWGFTTHDNSSSGNDMDLVLPVRQVAKRGGDQLLAAVSSVSIIDVSGGSIISISPSSTTTGTFIIEGTANLSGGWSTVEVYDVFSDLWVTGQNLTPTAGKTYSVLAGGMQMIRLRVTATLGAAIQYESIVDNTQPFIAGIDTGAAPHNFGYIVFHKEGNYAATQTSTTLHATTSGKRFAITDVTVSTDGTTSGVVTIYDATTGTAFSAGTTPSIFRAAFAPSATTKPGATKHFPVPYLSAAVSNSVLVTITGITASYIQINGYEI